MGRLPIRPIFGNASARSPSPKMCGIASPNRMPPEVQALLRDGGTIADNPALAHLLLDNLGPELASRGLRIGADEAALRELCEGAMAALPPRGAGADQLSACGGADYGAAIAESAFIRQVRRH